jgi:hypothetical protein
MDATYHPHITLTGLRRRASLIMASLVAIMAISWFASAGVAQAAGAPDTCTPGPNAGRAKATVNAGISMSTSSSTDVSHLITITAARNIWGWQDGGQLVPGVDTLQQELDAMAAITLPGTASAQSVPVHFATVPGFTPNTGSYPAGSSSGNIYPSFSLLSCLRNAYGSEVGMDYGAVYPNSLAGETTAQLKQNTCNTEQVFINHGFYRSWGAFAYANGQVSSSAQSVVASCFGFGRAYGSGVNSLSTLVNAPYTLHTLSLNGGSCSVSGLACSSVFARTYVMPGTITNALVQGARVWSSIQFYHLVNGSRQTGNLTWDCTNSNPAYHWTSRGEFYCESDLKRAVSNALSQLAAGSFLFVDPATGATITGRGKPTGAM